jgi:hypothetical protein
MQDKLVNTLSKSEKIDHHIEKMREMFHPDHTVKDGMYTPAQKQAMSIERTKLLLDLERSKKAKPMAENMTGDSYSDFNPDEVMDSLTKATPVDPIMEDTKQYEPKKESKPMQEESFPKFQYSIFVDNQRNAQMVIRANTFEEFKQLKKDADSLLAFTTTSANPMAQATVAPVNPPQAATPQYAPPGNTAAPICGIHNVPMVWKAGVSQKTGKPYGFYSCSMRNPDGSYCKYQPGK